MLKIDFMFIYRDRLYNISEGTDDLILEYPRFYNIYLYDLGRKIAEIYNDNRKTDEISFKTDIEDIFSEYSQYNFLINYISEDLQIKKGWDDFNHEQFIFYENFIKIQKLQGEIEHQNKLIKKHIDNDKTMRYNEDKLQKFIAEILNKIADCYKNNHWWNGYRLKKQLKEIVKFIVN